MVYELRVRGYRLRLLLFGVTTLLFIIAWVALPELRWSELATFIVVNLLFWLVHPYLQMWEDRALRFFYAVYLVGFILLIWMTGPETALVYYILFPLIVMGTLDYGVKGGFTLAFASVLLYLPFCLPDKVGLYVERAVILTASSFFMGLIGEEKRKIEVELASMEDYADLLVNSIKSGMIVTDKEGKVRSMNESAEEILGYRVDELKGLKIDEQIRIHQGESPLLKALKSHEPVERIDITVRTKSGEEIPAGVSVYLIQGKSKNEVLGAVEIFRDMSEIKEREALLQRQERLIAMGEMAAEVAHEIRNPLGGIKGFASLIQRRAQDDAIKRHAGFIIEGVSSIEKIVNDFLAYARPLKPVFIKADLHALIKDCLTTSLEGFEGIDVDLDLSEGIGDVELDVEQMKQVLRNLFINAAEAMPEGGTIYVRTYLWDRQFKMMFQGQERVLPPGKTVVVEVSDTGVGIPDEVKERIFNPFFTTKDTGTGLGLAIVHRIIEAHGGTISVRDRRGGGTTFTVKLPLTHGGD
jgi:PAS domain S-box-containing protein